MSSSVLSQLSHGVSRCTHALLYFIHTLILFTKTDINCTLVPVTLLAAASAPVRDIFHLPHAMFWLWLNILQFDVSNQIIGLDEDKLNKQWRPLPANRMTYNQAVVFRWLLIPACWLLSAYYSRQTVYASVALCTFTVMHNELAMHNHWFMKNVLNGLGFASFEVGATLIAGTDRTRLDDVAVLSVIASAGILVTTMHSQDFRDEEGDRAIGRKTIPIVFGGMAKYMLFVPMVLWSAGLCRMWDIDVATGLVFVALTFYVGFQYLIAHSAKEFQVAFNWYTVRRDLPCTFPGFCRGSSAPAEPLMVTLLRNRSG
ncbi:UbiA prenyltransferase family-domain-containing protein [Cubamyces menziesii]|nr:UbiA prenyltransferase family-domain-containing protein [Cubamyces menziesii]